MHRKPPHLLDRALTRRAPWQSLAFIVYALLLYGLPALAGWQLQRQPAGPAWLLLAPLTVASAYGLYLMAIIAHEGFHFSLSENRPLSCALGCLFGSLLPGFCATGFFVCHWQHHRHNNAERDPDYLHFRRYRSVAGKLLAARVAITWVYLVHTLRLAAGAHAAHLQLPLSDRRMQWLARFNLLCQALWLGAYGLLFALRPASLAVLLPVFLGALLIASCNAFQEHAFADGAAASFARSRTSWLLTLLHGGSNYHVEHHLYPLVPCWRLRRLHRALRQSGWYAQRGELLDGGTLGTFKYCLSQYRYGGSPHQPTEGKPL